MEWGLGGAGGIRLLPKGGTNPEGYEGSGLKGRIYTPYLPDSIGAFSLYK
jgi:hypothetical protein